MKKQTEGNKLSYSGRTGDREKEGWRHDCRTRGAKAKRREKLRIVKLNSVKYMKRTLDQK